MTAATSDSIGRATGADAGAGPSGPRSATHAFNPGDTIAGRYRIVSVLGVGGMGEVYRADDLTLGASVALKFLPADLVGDPVKLDRFRAEVRLTRQISHANVCRVYDIVEAEGRVFLTMEHIDGQDLSSLVRQVGRLPPDKAAEVGRQICAGLQAAHDQGVIHRDLKPSNVMLDGRGRARIMDFGIASVGEVRGESAVVGTPLYMAPEQLAGREATARSDIYSLGLVLHEVFTGRRVHDVETLADLRELHKTSTRPKSLSRYVSDLDPSIERAVLRCLEPDPADRPPSAIAVAAALPGGDPLAAALAAGETPSPELVASAGSRGGLPQWAGLTLIGLLIGIMVAVASIVDRSDMIAAADPQFPRSVMEQKARDIIAEFDGAAKHEHEASGWMLSASIVRWMQVQDSTPARWSGMRETPSGPVQFWYRASDAPMQGRGQVYDVEQDDPPRVGPGERLVRLDSLGNLLQLEIAPETMRMPVRAPQTVVAEPQVDRAFALAGLARSAFAPTDTRIMSRVELDQARAWVGPMPGTDGAEVRVDAGFRDGELRWFRVEHPVEVAATEGGPASLAGPPEWVGWATTALLWLIIAGSGVVAWKNIKARRCDIRAGVRASVTIVLLWGVGAVVMRDSVPDVQRMFFSESPIIGNAVLNAAYFLLFYIALEPTARKVWPSVLVSWIRLTSGRWRDPMVGRDVLVGVVVGAMVGLLSRLALLSPGWFGGAANTLIWQAPTPLMGTRHVLGFALWGLVGGVLNASVLTLLLVLFRVALRSRIAAMVVLAVLWIGMGSLSQIGNHWTSMIFIGVAQALTVGLLLRFGFLAMAVSGAVLGLILLVPAGFDTSAWWAGAAVIPAGVIAGLAAYGYFIATGDRQAASLRAG